MFFHKYGLNQVIDREHNVITICQKLIGIFVIHGNVGKKDWVLKPKSIDFQFQHKLFLNP